MNIKQILIGSTIFISTLGISQDPVKEQKNQKEQKAVQKKENIKVIEISRSEFEKLPIERQEIIKNAPDFKIIEDKKEKK